MTVFHDDPKTLEVLVDEFKGTAKECVEAQTFATVAAALDAALDASAEEDTLVVLGSFFTVAAALQYIEREESGHVA